MLPGAWGVVASPGLSFISGLGLVLLLIRLKFHRQNDGSLARRRLASVFILGATTYTFGIMVLSQLFLNGPHLSDISRYGFGDSRVSYLLVAVVFDGIFRIWDEYRPLNGSNGYS